MTPLKLKLFQELHDRVCPEVEMEKYPVIKTIRYSIAK
jgi:hypothetical protein